MANDEYMADDESMTDYECMTDDESLRRGVLGCPSKACVMYCILCNIVVNISMIFNSLHCQENKIFT
jgi:hypothetical protein